MAVPHIQIIVGSIRQQRFGEPVAKWFAEVAAERDDLTSELIDLADWELPFLTTPMPPMMGNYTDEHTLRWASKIADGDGYVFITPEYNHGYPASLKNAIDHLFAEWNRKPAGFVSYGGPGGGLRSVEQLRQVVVELDMVPVRAQVSIPRVYEAMGQDGRLRDPWHVDDAANLLNHVVWWASALKDAREPASAAARG